MMIVVLFTAGWWVGVGGDTGGKDGLCCPRGTGMKRALVIVDTVTVELYTFHLMGWQRGW